MEVQLHVPKCVGFLLRVYVTAKQEVFEFFDNAEHMQYRHTFSYGESIIQLLETW